MPQLVRDAAEQSARARADRRYGAGRIVSVDKVGHTAMVDVNAVDTQGNSTYIGPIPFQPQSPPTPGDTVTLAYANADAKSIYIVGSHLGGANAQSTITTVGGVTSIAAVGNPKITGDAELVAGTNCTLSQAGQQITIDVTIPPIGVVVEIDGSSATSGPRGTLNLETGQGMHLVITDDPTHDTVSVQFNSLFGTIPPTTVNHSVSPYTVPSGDFMIFCNTTAGSITINLPAPAANAGRLIVVLNFGSTGNAVTVATAVGSMQGITSITNATPGATAVWYISNGTNWYSITNSSGN